MERWWLRISVEFVEGNDFEKEIDLSYKLWVGSGNILWSWGSVFWEYESCKLDNKFECFRIFYHWIYGKW